MADKQSIGKKWGSLKRAARGSVKNLGNSSPNPSKGKNFSSFDEEVDNDMVSDEFGERQRSQEEIESITKVGMLIENFRLQCPQTHAGLVVAFTSTTLSPLNDSGIKFKWYRMGGGENNDQFKQIDESPRAWYPPTADDIGKKICANCEDNFEQGYCRYAEAGPVEADPLLVSMVESALKNGRHEVKDVCFSLGVKSLDPCNTEQNETLNLTSFDMSASQRPTSLVSTDAMTYPFLQFPSNIGLEVNYQGVFVNTTDAATSSTRRGMNILPSTDLEMFCTLPASFVIVVALPEDLRAMLDKKNSRRNNKNSFSDSDESEDESEHGEGSEKPSKATEDLLGLGAGHDAPEHSGTSGYEWIGYSKIDDAANGPGSEMCMLLDSFLTTLPGGTTHVRMCFSFADRMSRDAFALSCRVLAGVKPGAGYRERLRALPWFSEDGERKAVEVQSIGGNDLGRRLKELEEENTLLKRHQNELNLQIMEQSESQGPPSVSSLANVLEDTEEQSNVSQIVVQLRAKIRDVEKEITTYEQKEMEWEKSSLEMESRIKRIQVDEEVHTSTIAELHQRISESQAEAGAMRVLSEKYQAEMETIKAEQDAKVSEKQAQLEDDASRVSSLQSAVEKSAEELKRVESDLRSERETVEVHKLTADERMHTINGLRDQIISLEAEAAEVRNLREHFEELLAEKKRDLERVASERDEALKSHMEAQVCIEALQTEVDTKDKVISVLEGEKEALLSDSVTREELSAVEERALQLEGERNQLKKLTSSLQKDMKKVVKELQHQIWLTEEDLARSNERCEELRGVMSQMAEDDLKRTEEELARKSKSGLMGKMKSIRKQTSTASVS